MLQIERSSYMKGTDTLSQEVFSSAESSDLPVSKSRRGRFDENNFKFCSYRDCKYNKGIRTTSRIDRIIFKNPNVELR